MRRPEHGEPGAGAPGDQKGPAAADSIREVEVGPPAERPRRGWVFFLRLAATAALLALLIRFIEPGAFFAALRGADLRFLWLIFLLRPGIYLVRGWRFWHLLHVGLRHGDHAAPLPMRRTIGWHFVSLNLGTFTPAGLGEVSLVYFLRQRGIGAGDTLSAMILDKIITLAMVSAMGVVGAVLYLGLDIAWLWLLGAGALLALFLLQPLRRVLESWRTQLGKKGKLTARVAKLMDGIAKMLDFVWVHPKAFAINVLVAIFQSLLFTAQIWIGFRMLHELVSFSGIFWLTGLGRLINMLPITLGGLGVYEGSMVLLLEELGAGREASLAAVLVPRTITWIVAGVVIAYFLWRRPRSLQGQEAI